MNQIRKMNLHSWIENCDVQIILNEEQAIQYLVNYASKSEKSFMDMSEIIQYLAPININAEQSEGDNKNAVPMGGQDDNISGPTIIRIVALNYSGIRNKTQQ